MTFSHLLGSPLGLRWYLSPGGAPRVSVSRDPWVFLSTLPCPDLSSLVITPLAALMSGICRSLYTVSWGLSAEHLKGVHMCATHQPLTRVGTLASFHCPFLLAAGVLWKGPFENGEPCGVGCINCAELSTLPLVYSFISAWTHIYSSA